jgi:hypothetical protein
MNAKARGNPGLFISGGVAEKDNDHEREGARSSGVALTSSWPSWRKRLTITWHRRYLSISTAGQ